MGSLGIAVADTQILGFFTANPEDPENGAAISAPG